MMGCGDWGVLIDAQSELVEQSETPPGSCRCDAEVTYDWGVFADAACSEQYVNATAAARPALGSLACDGGRRLRVLDVLDEQDLAVERSGKEILRWAIDNDGACSYGNAPVLVGGHPNFYVMLTGPTESCD